MCKIKITSFTLCMPSHSSTEVIDAHERRVDCDGQLVDSVVVEGKCPGCLSVETAVLMMKSDDKKEELKKIDAVKGGGVADRDVEDVEKKNKQTKNGKERFSEVKKNQKEIEDKRMGKCGCRYRAGEHLKLQGDETLVREMLCRVSARVEAELVLRELVKRKEDTAVVHVEPEDDEEWDPIAPFR